MDIATMTEAEFLNVDESNEDSHPPCWGAVRFHLNKHIRGAVAWDLGGGYTIEYLGSKADVCASSQGHPVGLYLGQILSVDPDHKRHGLATAMILIAARHRPKPAPRHLTENGRKALAKAWRVANGLDPMLLPLPPQHQRFSICIKDASGVVYQVETDDRARADRAVGELDQLHP